MAPKRFVSLALLVIAGGGACRPVGPPRTSIPGHPAAPSAAGTATESRGRSDPEPAPPAVPPPEACVADFPASSRLDPEHDARLAKRCDASARCQLACLRAKCESSYGCADACREIAARARRRGETEGDALQAAEGGFALRNPAVCRNARPLTLEGALRVQTLARFYEQQARGHASARDACHSNDPRTRITEIAIERTPCYGRCPVDTLSLRSDGSVEYFGEAFVEHLGARHGTISTDRFDWLARLAEDLGWFEMASSYSCTVTDNPAVYTSLVRAGVRKTIRHYAPAMTGPPRLELFEETISNFADFVVWAD